MAAPETPPAGGSKKKLFYLKSCEGDTFEVDESIALQFTIIKNTMNEEEDDNNFTVFPFTNVDTETLLKVIDYCKEHVTIDDDDEQTSKKKKSEKELKEWDYKFISAFDQAILYDVLIGANYLGVNGLLDLAAKRVADMIKGKTPDKIRKLFHIKNDFSPEEEDEIRRENAWAFEESNPQKNEANNASSSSTITNS